MTGQLVILPLLACKISKVMNMSISAITKRFMLEKFEVMRDYYDITIKERKIC